MVCKVQITDIFVKFKLLLQIVTKTFLVYQSQAVKSLKFLKFYTTAAPVRQTWIIRWRISINRNKHQYFYYIFGAIGAVVGLEISLILLL